MGIIKKYVENMTKYEEICPLVHGSWDRKISLYIVYGLSSLPLAQTLGLTKFKK